MLEQKSQSEAALRKERGELVAKAEEASGWMSEAQECKRVRAELDQAKKKSALSDRTQLKMENDLSKAREKFEIAQRGLSFADKTVDTLRREVDDLRKLITSRKAAAAAAAAVEEKAATAAKAPQLGLTMTRSEAIRKEDYSANLVLLQEDVERLERENSVLEKHVQRLEREVEDLTSDNETLQQRCRDLDASVRKKKQKKDVGLLDEATNAGSSVKKSRKGSSARQDAEAKAEALSVDLRLLKEELVRTKSQMGKARRQNMAYNRELRAARKALQTSTTRSREEIADLNSSIACVGELSWRALFPVSGCGCGSGVKGFEW